MFSAPLRTKLPFYGLISYILISLILLNTHFGSRVEHWWGQSGVWLLNASGILSLMSLYKTHTLNPGDIPEDWDSSGVADGFGLSQWNLCKICNGLVLPPRAQHCKALNRCVSRYDHYCPWAGNAIGQNNYRFYILLLTYGVLAVGGVALGTSSTILWCFTSNCDDGLLITILTMILLVVSIVIGYSLFNLWYFHMLLLRCNFTTKEFFTWKEDLKSVKDVKTIPPSLFDSGSFISNVSEAFQVKKISILLYLFPW